MIILGIESSADKLGVGIITSDGTILANERATYKPPVGEGIHPRKASEHHAANIKILIERAIKSSKISPKDIDLIAFTRGSGIGPCLRVGAIAARTLALTLNKPIIGVNHQVAHVEIGKLVGNLTDPVTLYVSGGNTQIIAFAGGKYRVFGETMDMPVGNCLDVFGREAKIDPGSKPMGRMIELLALKGKTYIPLPYAIKGMDVSLSGILTEAIKLYKSNKYPLEDLCYSLQETIFSMLVEVTERALAQLRKNEILVTGGVAANNRLKEMLSEMAREHDARFFGLNADLAIDNGVMIAWLGYLSYTSGQRMDVSETFVEQRYRPEEVKVTWI